MKPTSLIFYLVCFTPPSIKFIPQTTTHLTFRRNEEIFLSSMIEFICNQSFTIFPQWTIHNASGQISFHSTILQTSSTDLYIPPQTLSIGLYEFHLTVTTSIASHVTSSKSISIQINPSGVTMNLIPSRLSMITHGYQQHLQLNPGKYSIDHDGYPFQPHVSLKLQYSEKYM